MGRKVQLDRTDLVPYVPDCLNRGAGPDGEDVRNRDDPEPFYVDVLPMSGNQYKAYESQVGVLSFNRRGRLNDLGKKQLEVARLVFKHNLPNVYNYTARSEKTGEVVDVTTGAQLFDVLLRATESESDLVDELVTAARDSSVLEAGRKKG